ncbi:MAG: N-acetylmuramoyl-L-alanine amidase [Victivallales bacterium]|nr:N-acetylmuramoyl-L-alanine amidase [Victivallales bacterium]
MYFRSGLVYLLGALTLAGGYTAGAAVPAPATTTAAAQDEIVINGLPIRLRLVEDNQYNRRYKLPGPMTEVKSVTIHNTAEPFSAKQERERVNNRRDNASVSFHFAVDEAEAVQILPLGQHGWHAGDGNGNGNMHSIGIEICRSQCYGRDEHLYRSAEANAAVLAAWLLKEHRLGIDALKKHQDWNGKYCPHRILEEKRWQEFKARVAAQMKNPQMASLEPAAPLREAVCIGTRKHADGKTGPYFQSFSGKSFDMQRDYIADLKRHGIKEIDVSDWVKDLDCRPILKDFRDAGINVRFLYVWKSSAPDWDREDIVRTTNGSNEFRDYMAGKKK